MRATFTLALATSAAAFFSNSVPIYGTYPGWIEGKDKVGITLEVHWDLLCEDSKALAPILVDLLATPWLDGTVADQISIRYSLFPLPYHLHTWQVNQMMPYFIDNCMTDATTCSLIDEYKDYAFQQQPSILAEVNTSKDDFIKQWTKQVADKFALEQSDLEGIYDRDHDQHNTEGKLREMWKFGTARTVSGTPTTFLNGVKMDSTPFTVNGWMEVLNSVYKS